MIKSVFIFVMKIFLTQTERGLNFAFACGVLFFSFFLFLIGLDGWRFGLIGVLCLTVLKARDILDAFHFPKHRPEKNQSVSAPPETPVNLPSSSPDTAEEIKKTLETIRRLIPDAAQCAQIIQSVHGAAKTAKKVLIAFWASHYSLPQKLVDGLQKNDFDPAVFGFYVPDAVLCARVLNGLEKLIKITESNAGQPTA